MKKTDSHIFVGMKRDLSPSRQEDKYLWQANNIRIKPIDSNNTMGSITNEKGNRQVELNRYNLESNSTYSKFQKIDSDIKGIVLGYCIQDKYLILFTHDKFDKKRLYNYIDDNLKNFEQYQIENYIFENAIHDRIYRIEFVDDEPVHSNDSKEGHILTLLYEGDLNFDLNNPIESFVVKESEFIHKVYWIDGRNQLRCINATKDQLIEKYLNRSECNKQVKRDIQNIGIENYPFYNYKDIYSTRNPFDTIQQCDLNEDITIIRRNDLTGSFPPCTIQYAFTYYNKYGSETNIVYTSQLFYVSPNDRGGRANDSVSCAFQIEIDNIQTTFDYLRIYSIKRTIKDGPAEVKIVNEISTNDIQKEKEYKQFSYISPNNKVVKVDEDYISNFNAEKVIVTANCKNIRTSIDDKKTKFYVTPLDNISSIRIQNINGITYEFNDLTNICKEKVQNVESYVFNIIYSNIYNSLDIYLCPKPIYIYKSIPYKTVKDINKKYIIYDTNSYGEIIDGSQFISKNRTTLIPKTISHFNNTLFLGNYDYQLFDLRQILKSKGYFTNSSRSDISRSKLDNLHIYYGMRNIDIDEKPNSRNYTYSNQLQNNTSYLKWNENYRLGFQCQDKYGKWSDPIWIKDIGVNNNEEDNINIQNRPYLDGKLALPYPYVDLTFNNNGLNKEGFKSKQLLYDLYNNGYRTIRPVVVFPKQNDKHIVAQGVITPTVFNDYLRTRNAPYSQPSWFVRPIVSNMDNYRQMKFLEYRNMRPLQAQRTYFAVQNTGGGYQKYFYSPKQVTKYFNGEFNPWAGMQHVDGHSLNPVFQGECQWLGTAIVNSFGRGNVGLHDVCNINYCEIQNTDYLYPYNFQYINAYNGGYQPFVLAQGMQLALERLSSLALKGRYRVDQTIQQFHSPEIEFDESLKNVYFGNYDIQIDGILPLKKNNTTNYKILETESATGGIQGKGFYGHSMEEDHCTEALYNDNGIDYIVTSGKNENGDNTGTAGYFAGDGGFGGAGSVYGDYYIYPWQRHGSITNDINRNTNEGVMSSKLKYNQTSILRFIDTVLYFNNSKVKTANDLPIIKCNSTHAQDTIDFYINKETADPYIKNDIPESIDNICFSEAQMWDYTSSSIKIDDYMYFGNIDQANLCFSGNGINPYDNNPVTGCPTLWNGSQVVWNGQTNGPYWGDFTFSNRMRSSGVTYPAFSVSSAVEGSSYNTDWINNFSNYKFGYNRKFMYSEKGLDLNSNPVRIKYKSGPHLVLKFKTYGTKQNDALFSPDPQCIRYTKIHNSNSSGFSGIRAFSITKSYIDQFASDDKKQEKKGDKPFNVATQQRVIINRGYDFEAEGQWFYYNHIYFYTGRGNTGYGITGFFFEPGTIFVDQNGTYFQLQNDIEDVSFISGDGKDESITRGKARNKVKEIGSQLAQISEGQKPTVGLYEWDVNKKKWKNNVDFNSPIVRQSNVSIGQWPLQLTSIYTSDPYLFQISLINNNNKSLFGGDTEYAIENNVWCPADVQQPIDLNNGNILRWTYGDTWYQRYDCLRTFPVAPTDENQVTEIVSFMAETNINIDGRYDRNRGQDNNTVMSPTNFNLLNRCYTQTDNFFQYKILDGDNYKNTSYPSTIIWSLPKSNNSEIDNYSQITELSQQIMDSRLGNITDIQAFNNLIYVFQEQGFSRLKYNDSVALNTQEGTPIELSNSNGVTGFEIISDNAGCNNKWSILVTDDAMYFIDSFSGYIYMLPGGTNTKKQLQALSTAANFDTWCRRYYSNIPWYINLDNDNLQFTGIRTFYDFYNGNIYFTSNIFNNNDESIDKQLMFCKNIMAFESYMPYWRNVIGMFNIQNNMYTITFDKINDKEEHYISKIWQSWKGEYNKFYNKVEPYSITFISNKEKGESGLASLNLNKVFDNISFIADVKEDYDNKLKFTDEYNSIKPLEDSILESNLLIKDGYGQKFTLQSKKDLRRKNILKKPFDHIRVWNEYQDTGLVPLNYNILKPSNMKASERKWNIQIPRDKRYKLQRISNPWTYIQLSKFPNNYHKTDNKIKDGSDYNDSDNFRMELHNIDVDFYLKR